MNEMLITGLAIPNKYLIVNMLCLEPKKFNEKIDV